MPEEVSPEHIADRLERVEQSLGVGQLPHVRECVRILREVASILNADGALADQDKIQLFSLAMADGWLIADAAEELLKAPEVPTARGRLVEALVSQSLHVPGRGQDQARNALWELFLAARFRSRNLEPRFGDQVCAEGDRKPDLFLNVEGMSLAIEAKRSRAKVFANDDARRAFKERVQDAVEQIAAACNAGLSSFGFIALDASFAVDLHPQERCWELPDETAAASEAELRRQWTAQLASLQQEIMDGLNQHPQWRDIGDSVLGVAMLLMPTLRTSTGKLKMVRYFHCARYEPRSSTGLSSFDTVQRLCFSEGDSPAQGVF